MSTLFGTGPVGAQASDSASYNLGTVIRCNVAGNITALRFYVTSPHDPFTSTLRLYIDGTTTPVREVTAPAWVYANPSQWVEVPITPYPVGAGQVVMSAYTITGYYTAVGGGLLSDITNADGALTAPSTVNFNGVSTNGRYSTTLTAIPDQNYNYGLYFADLVLTTGALTESTWDGSAWRPEAHNEWDGTAWKSTSRSYWNGTSWV